MKSIVVINGGRGAASIIPCLNEIEGWSVTSIVNAFDDGKSTGKIRQFFGILGPSDIRKVQELLLPQTSIFYKHYVEFFQFRYPLDVNRNEILKEMSCFCDGTHISLCGVKFEDKTVRNALRNYIRYFLNALRIEENYRRAVFDFSDCAIMNCIYAGAILSYRKNLETATARIGKIFNLVGTVIPSSISNRFLVAVREDGEFLNSEAEIVELRSNARIDRIFFLDERLDRGRVDPLSKAEKTSLLQHKQQFVKLTFSANSALRQADVILYAPGTQHSSLYPTYLTQGLAETIASNKKALKVFVTNIGADYETPTYKASDYFTGAFKYFNLLSKNRFKESDMANLVLVNENRLKEDINYVELDRENLNNIPVNIKVDNFEDKTSPGKHDGRLIVETIMEYYSKKI